MPRSNKYDSSFPQLLKEMATAESDALHTLAIESSTQETDCDLIPTGFEYKSFKHLSAKQVENCMVLIEENIKQIYIKSGTGWSKSEVLKEIQDPEGRFLLLDEGRKGLAYFQFSTDAELVDEYGNEIYFPCVYLVHIHVSKAIQASGLGTKMMETVCKLASRHKFPKVKLTVFKVNEIALNWYLKLGFDLDCTDLSNFGEESSYCILSKAPTQ
jgi:GNAT superfamily N-acetyltransferase